MKVARERILGAVAQWPAGVRAVLLHGGDDSASRDLAARFVRAFATAADPLAVETLDGGSLGKDPQALVAAAAARSMFGDRTLVRVDDAGDDCVAAFAALLDAPEAGNPVVAVAGTLRKGSKLLTLAEGSPAVLALPSYAPEGAGQGAAADEVAREFGVTLPRGAGRALYDASGGDRAVLRQEVAKLALYLDAAADRPVVAEPADLAAIGADLGEAATQTLVAHIAGGDAAAAERQLARLLPAMGGIPLLRALTRHFWQLLDLRAAVDGGASPSSAVESARPPVFFKEKAARAAELARWRTPMLRAALARLLAVERDIKSSGSAGDVLAGQALLGIAVQARGRR